MDSLQQSAQAMEAGIADYGAMKSHQALGNIKRPVKEKASFGIVLGCVVLPTLIFTVTFFVVSFSIRYWYGIVSWILVGGIVLVCLTFAWMTYEASCGKGGDPLWFGWLTILSFIAVWSASVIGNINYNNNMRSFYELEQLNAYSGVDASTALGSQYMDFGIINFAAGSWIDRMYAMAFQNENTYCVAPVVFNNTKPKSYDFWVTGTNCCSKHLFNFNCGMWNNPAAHSGIRVMGEEYRQFYQLAVQQASAAYDIPVNHPIFLTWVTSPEEQVLGYQAKGMAAFETCVFVAFFVCLFSTFAAGWVISKA